MPSGRTAGHKKLKFGEKMRILAKRQERLLWEEIAKLLGRYRSSFNHLVAKSKNLPILIGKGRRRGQKNGIHTDNYSCEVELTFLIFTAAKMQRKVAALRIFFHWVVQHLPVHFP
jgi:hypothetical protein